MSFQTLWLRHALNHSYTWLCFTGIFSSVNPEKRQPCMPLWPHWTVRFYTVKLHTTSSLSQDRALRGYLLNNSTANQVDCWLCLIFVFRGRAQLWGCSTGWSRTTARHCGLAEQFGITFDGQTPTFGRQDFVQRCWTACGVDYRAVLPQDEPWPPWTAGEYQACFKNWWETWRS